MYECHMCVIFQTSIGSSIFRSPVEWIRPNACEYIILLDGQDDMILDRSTTSHEQVVSHCGTYRTSPEKFTTFTRVNTEGGLDDFIYLRDDNATNVRARNLYAISPSRG